MSAEAAPRRLWGHAFALDDLLAGYGGSREFAVRDFALLTLALRLSARFPGQLVFKGALRTALRPWDRTVSAKMLMQMQHDPPKEQV